MDEKVTEEDRTRVEAVVSSMFKELGLGELVRDPKQLKIQSIR